MTVIVRPLTAAERGKFVDFSADPVENERLRSHLENALSKAETAPEWCLVADDGGRFVGRLYLWGPPSNPVFVHLFDLEWSRGDWREVGLELVRGALAAAGDPENGILYALDDPHPWHSEPARRAALFERAGFRVVRRGQRWERRTTPGNVASPHRLGFRTLADVGDDAFRDAIARVSDGTLDGRLQEMRGRLGREGDAAEHFRLLMGLRHEPEWWQLAFDPSGELVGLIVAGGDVREPVIAYVGVVPEQRGRRYVDALLSQATAVLTASEADVIRADTDVLNVPMAKAFQRAGFVEFMTRTEYMIAGPVARARLRERRT